MPDAIPTLHMLCGKIASGKSTLAAELANDRSTVLISEDHWLSILFGDQMTTVDDYVRYAAKLRLAMGSHVTALLNAGVSIALDFPANTKANRVWLRDLLEGAEANHKLHYLNVSDEECMERLLARNAEGKHAFSATREQFLHLTRHFVPPSPEEGFDIETHYHKW